jgi:hypothetical protein
MTLTRSLVAVAALSALTTLSVAAANPVGKWTGRLLIDLSKMPAQQRQQAAPFLENLKKLKVSLTLKGDHTFLAVTEGVPTGGGGKQSDSGKWSFAGNKVTLKGKNTPPTGQTFTLSKDGRTMSAVMPGGQSGKVEFVFSR